MIRHIAVALVVLVMRSAPARADGELHDTDGAAFPELSGVSITASSTLAGNGDRYAAWHVLSPGPGQDRDRFWCEGKPDAGLGETLVLDLAEPQVVTDLVIAAGVQKSEALFRANNIVTGLDVTTDDGRVFHVVAPATRDEVHVAIGGKAMKRLTVAITNVKPGKMNDSCISELSIDPTDTFGTWVVGATAAQTAALVPTLIEINRARTACDAASLRAHLAFPFSHTDWLGEDHHDRDAYKTYRYKDAAALLATCSGHGHPGGLFAPISASIRVGSDGPGAITVIDRGSVPAVHWHLALHDGAWQLRSTSDKD